MVKKRKKIKYMDLLQLVLLVVPAVKLAKKMIKEGHRK
ncbi:hypothetical protein CECT5772_00116 [Streptococcus equi subsp. ruminatorum CECT 5772]|uniref:Uncharacterized protein n=1 Tax=Streptococcus equi subsp. ruminatorum CECT 5772 TaxID=1051981 RepID=A0A922NX12_9STRE|nr:hypothetical protein CECT5772_00116 [Streptococcus equi subsp. ruminatorum CECT 5772]